MSGLRTVRELAAIHPEMHDYDYRWRPGHFDPGYHDARPAEIGDVLANRGYRLADGDRDVAGKFNDIKGYYGCGIVPL